MTDLILALPELVLVGVALALIVVARHVKRARSAAAWRGRRGGRARSASGWAFAGAGRTTGFGGTIAGDGYAQFFKVLFAATLALAALLSVRHLDAERVPPAEYLRAASPGLDRHDAGGLGPGSV